MTNIITAVFLALFGNTVIYSGLAFINGEFFSNKFGSIYTQTNTIVRLVIVSLTFAPLANFVFSRVYKLTDPAIAGMVMLASLVFILVGKSLFLGMGSLTPRLIAAVITLTLCAVWVSYELHCKI